MNAVVECDLELLGRFVVRTHGAQIALPPQSQRVVAFVALRERGASRRSIADHLWPERSGDRASAALRSALWQIERRAGGLLSFGLHDVRLSPAVRLDLDRRREAIDAIEQTATARPRLDEFVDDLLPEWDEQWLVFEREWLRQQRLHALEALCRRHVDHFQYEHALEAGLCVVAAEPLRESAQRALIAAHLAEGNRSEALRQYNGYIQLLDEELGLRPSPDLDRFVHGSSA